MEILNIRIELDKESKKYFASCKEVNVFAEGEDIIEALKNFTDIKVSINSMFKEEVSKKGRGGKEDVRNVEETK